MINEQTAGKIAEFMRTDEFHREFRFLRPGQRLEYYRGFMMLQRTRKSIVGNALNALGNLAWKEYELGRATLYQRRHGFMDYSYYVERK